MGKYWYHLQNLCHHTTIIGHLLLTLNIPMEWIVHSNSIIDELLQNPFQNVRDKARNFV